MNKRKLQLCNGYLLEFDQLARVIHAMAEHRKALKITRKELCDATGLTDRHVESVVSIGSAIGAIQPGRQILSPVGRLVADHDAFIETRASLEWLHYVGAGSFKNLVWFEVFNTLLPSGSTMTENDWTQRLKDHLAGEYTEKSLSKNLREEVRFVVDAYLNREFRKLDLLHISGERLYTKRSTEITLLIFAAAVYDFAYKLQATLVQVDDLAIKPGSPGLLFAMDEASVREHLEKLHERGWVRYETTHNLNQARLREEFTPHIFLKAHYENREPAPEPEP